VCGDSRQKCEFKIAAKILTILTSRQDVRGNDLLSEKLSQELEKSTGGAPTKLTRIVAEAIISSVRRGNFVSPAAEAAGVARNTVSQWKRKAESLIEPYYSFFEGVKLAIAEAEQETVQELREHADWRAKAWWLERGPNKERWSQQQGNPATDLAVALLDQLRTRTVGTSPEGAVNAGFKELPETQSPEDSAV